MSVYIIELEIVKSQTATHLPGDLIKGLVFCRELGSSSPSPATGGARRRRHDDRKCQTPLAVLEGALPLYYIRLDPFTYVRQSVKEVFQQRNVKARTRTFLSVEFSDSFSRATPQVACNHTAGFQSLSIESRRRNSVSGYLSWRNGDNPPPNQTLYVRLISVNFVSFDDPP